MGVSLGWEAQLQAALQARTAASLYRRRRVLQGAQGVRVEVDGRRCINFSSNDYLGLASHPEVIAANQQASARYGCGSGASHLVCGHSAEHHALEQELAAFTGRERALLFSSGYMANLGTVSALMARGDSLYEDKLNHASLLDAGRLSGARLLRFRHNEAAHLGERLGAAGAAGRQLIAVDGVYSMDGDLAPLPELALLAEQHDAWLMVDDAHGFGVLGETGAGSLQHWQLGQRQVPVLMATLGKALGTFGAFVAGSELLIETLIQQARSYIYTTALPPAVAAATRVSLTLAREQCWRRSHLQTLIRRLRGGLAALPYRLMPSETAIQPLLVGDSDTALQLSEYLWQRGLWVPAIRPPTVPRDTARLRITLSATHSEADVDQLVDALAQLGT